MTTSWTRRGFLLGATGALAAGCASTVAGTPLPAAGPRSGGPAPTSTRRPPRRVPVRLGVIAGSRDASGELTGQSVEVARAVLTSIEVTDIEIVQVEFDSRLAQLSAGRLDLLADLDNTRAHCQAAVLSAPDYVSLTALAVPPGNPKGLKTFAEVVATGATVAVMDGLPQREDAVRAGVPAGRIAAFPAPVEMLTAVSAGQADCAVFFDIALRAMTTGGLAKLDVTNGFTVPGQAVPAFSFGFAKKVDDDLVTGFNTELAKLHRSGEWLRISQPYGFTRDNLPPADLTVEKLCS